MKENTLIEIRNAVPRIKDLVFTHPINWKINNNEHWAVIGPNGSGKSLLIDFLMKRHGFKDGQVVCVDENGNNKNIRTFIKNVAFKDIYSLADMKEGYYQQRWNTGLEQNAPIIKDFFIDEDQEWVNTLISYFKIEDLVNRKISLLSSGELRKFLIIRSLLEKPNILILDYPFIGLDAKSREILREVFEKLASMENLQIILVLSDPADIPNIITHILPIKDKTVLPFVSREKFINDEKSIKSLFIRNKEVNLENVKKTSKEQIEFENALIFKNVYIKYGTRTILRNLNWQVKKGDKWALLGENGSGKSTLLSLVAADNPQAYANDITLFDRKRGTGESIWDIKKHIGYVSPEMHLYYLKNVKCLDVVSSGFFDTIGLYRKCNEDQEKTAFEWMKIFGIEDIKNTSFLNISVGEQRLALLARVFVKNPKLLILDEPMHGLDIDNKIRIKKIIEDFCTPEKALIYVTHYEEEIPNVVNKRLVLTKQE